MKWCWTAVAALGVVLGAGCRSAPAPQEQERVQTVVLRGHIHCRAQPIHTGNEAAVPAGHVHLWTLRAADGVDYELVRDRFSEAIWLDARVRAQGLEIKARRPGGARRLEVERLRSIKNGVVHDLYYYCDICHIESVAPELCGCCQGPVELVERPLQ